MAKGKPTMKKMAGKKPMKKGAAMMDKGKMKGGKGALMKRLEGKEM